MEECCGDKSEWSEREVGRMRLEVRDGIVGGRETYSLVRWERRDEVMGSCLQEPGIDAPNSRVKEAKGS
jgi:hypothetical protein